MKEKWEWVGGFLIVKGPLRPGEAIKLCQEISKHLTANSVEEECHATEC